MYKENMNRNVVNRRKPSRKANSGIVAIFTVAAILILIWLVTLQFISSVGSRKNGVAVSEDKHSQTSDAKKGGKADKKGEKAGKGEGSKESTGQGEGKVKVLVEGNGDYRKADSWIGKTFTVKEASNVRSGPGTSNPILASATQGSKIYVKESEEVDDAIWVKGEISIQGGETLEGWLYVFVLSTEASQ